MPLGVGEEFAGYTIERQLGSGGMGEVYLAQHPRLPRHEALKVLRSDISKDDSFRQRFIREADSIATLEHPNIVTVHDRGDTDGRLWIATQYINGTDAAQLLRDRYPAGMPADEAASIATAVAEALDFAHEHGLIHRDVKPANVLLTQPDRNGVRRIYLADFGIARPLDDPAGLTSTNFTVGTFAYAAPEQLMGKAIDGRADQYALAATTYHLLTGTPVFSDSNQIAVISQHLTETPPRPSTIRPELAPLDAAFARALSKNPADRYSSCSEFAKAITAASNESGVGYSPTAPTQQAPIPTPQTAAAATGRRSPARAVVVTGVMAGLLIASALLWHPWAKQDQATAPTSPTTAVPPATTTPVPSSNPPIAPSTTPPPTTTIKSTPLTQPPPTYPSASATTPTVAASPIAIVGSWCYPQSSPTLDPDGVQIYCAQFPRTDGFIWTREVVRFPCGNSTCTGVRTIEDVLDAAAVRNICVSQTGWTPSTCTSAIANATYSGDGPRPICMGASSECNPGRR